MPRRAVLAGLLAAALLLLLAFLWKSFFVDDAFIGFRYVDNALLGRGLVFNPPERVEGVSNIGWLLVLLPFARIMPVTAAAKILSFVLVFAALALLARFVSRWPGAAGERLVLSFLPLLAVVNVDLTYFSLAGMETALAAFVLSLMLVLSARRKDLALLAVLGAFLFLVRPEGVLLFPFFLVFRNGTSAARWKSSAGAILAFVGLLALFTLARKTYYGAYLPNTFGAKSTSWSTFAANTLSFLTGSNVNIPFPIPGWLALPVWFNGLRLALRADRAIGALLGGALSTGILFCLYAVPDWTGMGRYFAPYIPLALFVFLAGLSGLIRSLVLFSTRSAKSFPFLTGLAVAGLIVSGAVGTFFFMQPVRAEDYPGYVLTGVSLVGPSLWMRDHLPPDAVVAAGRIGALGYYSQKKIFDYKFGLTDPAVAALRRAAKEPFEDPRDPALAEIWAKTDPGYFLEDLRRIRNVFHADPEKSETLIIHGRTFRPIKTFPVGLDADWVLCERTDRLPDPGPAKAADPASGGQGIQP